jgi:hypothetical protein
MKLKKFEQLNDPIDETLEDILELYDENEYIGSYSEKKMRYTEIGFLFGQINSYNANIINSIKEYIKDFNNIDIKSLSEVGDRKGVQIIFYLNDSNLNKLKNKIGIEIDSKKYNL